MARTKKTTESAPAAYRTVKVPEWAAREANVLRAQLSMLGTSSLPREVRPKGPITLGHVFVVGLRELQRCAMKKGAVK